MFFEEKLFGTISWNYSNAILNIDGRTTILYCIGWGILGVIYARFVYSKISKILKNQKTKVYFIISVVAITLVIIDITITTLSSIRYYQRRCGIGNNSFIEHILDEEFPDSKMNWIFKSREIIN